MPWVIYLFGSGLAFFVGVAFVLVAVGMSLGRLSEWPGASNVLAIIGVVLAIVSSAPLPIGFYVLATSLTVIWLIVARCTPASNKWLQSLRAFVALVWLGAAVFELPNQWLPDVRPEGSRRLYLFGDSLATGVNERAGDSWPELLADSHRLDLVNLSRSGATVAVALQKANNESLGEGLVLLEIGGNDLLGDTDSERFGQKLDALLERVCQPGRQVLMFELPLLPFYNQFGRIQRRLAAQYQVSLIPKRVLMEVLTGSGATLDSIHLTAAGHERMAEIVWGVIGSAYDPSFR